MGKTPTSEPLHRQDFAVHSYEVDTNTRYVEWALETVPDEVHELRSDAAGHELARARSVWKRLR